MKHILLTIVFLLCCWLPVKCEETGASVAEAVWAEMLAFTPTVKLSDKIIVEIESQYPLDAYWVDDSMYDYWRQISDACSQSFLKGFRKAKEINQIDQFAKKYVGFFGTKDAISDMRWVLGFPLLAVNSDIILNGRNKHTAEFKTLALYFNKYVVENALTNKVYYKRIHWFTLWASEFPFTRRITSDASSLNAHVKNIQTLKAKEKWDETCFEYWYNIRLQLSIYWLCNLEDQLMALTPITEDKMKKIEESDKGAWAILLTTNVYFDTNNLKYEIWSEKSFPPIILPREPFPDTPFFNPFFRVNGEFKTVPLFPRISPALMHLFVEDCIQHIIKR